ncbi:MAG: hypothetical protein LF888_06520 [Candidatus Megaira endosymbiont of Mesostigma viride]|jgi:hypothetical protein|nr:MAG: hypothetical protein LF888_06520 [Candidatus Megaira endosymbiont of Mesostigma viride]HJK88258.1 hypothetical protein [Candidatus Megaira endosymbiont of Mesostigma viride]
MDQGLKIRCKTKSIYNLVQGYKSDQQGVVVGLDLMDNSVGLAYAFIQDNVKGIIQRKE